MKLLHRTDRTTMTDLRRHVAPIALDWDDEAAGQLWRQVSGTLVFVDISGFTALTEKLSRRGRIGAEEIITTLNRVFGPMLGISSQRGGELLKFGGDALLFLFQGPEHTLQAVDAAIEMRAELRLAAAEPTSVGRVALSMSVGVHSGPVDLFLVGSPTRELLILGPAADETVAAEKVAAAGEIVVSAATATLLPAAATRADAAGVHRLRWRTPHSKAPGQRPPAEVGRARLATLFPAELGQHLDAGPPEPEHRTATIAFVRFCGADAMLTSAGPQALALALHELVTIVESAAAAHGVTLLATDLDSDGGKFFLGSGVPRASEDDEGRMLRALRDIQVAGTRLPPTADNWHLPLQLGVNRGHVFAAEIGVPERAAYSAMGDTTNTAARIMSKAPTGALYAHPGVTERSRAKFTVTPAGPYPMKGKAAPVLVHEVGPELGLRAGEPVAAGLPFLGREAQFAQLRDTLAQGLSGSGSVVTLSGATGMGKSRLAREVTAVLRDRPGGLSVLSVHAEPYGASSAYRVFRDPMRALLGITRGEPAAMGEELLTALGQAAPDLLWMAPLLADVVGVEVAGTKAASTVEPQFRPDRTADALIRLLEALLPGPLLVVAEEAHWADGASAGLLERLAGAAAGRPWAVLAVRRGDSGGFAPTAGQVVPLSPLPDSVVERLVLAATESTPLRPHEVAAIVARAGGSPLFVSEVARVARGAGALEVLPDSVQAAMSAQIDQLAHLPRQVLRYASVLGRSFRREVLRETLAINDIDLAEATLRQLADFLVADGGGRLRFRNSLVRDAAYEGLAYRTRARLHLAAGLAVERLSVDSDSDAATLSLHFWKAGDYERTWRYARIAGAMAQRSYANADAAAEYERALEASRRLVEVSDAERAVLLALLGQLYELAGMLPDSLAAYRRAAAITADPVGRAELVVRRARVQERAGQFRAALQAVSAARKLLVGAAGSHAQRVSVALDTLVALIRLGQEKPREARKWALHAASAARGTDDPETLVQALMAIDYAEIQLGMPGVGTHTREALDICMAHGFRPRESVARANLGVYAFYAGRWDEAVEWFTSSRQVAVTAGNDFGAAETDLSLADILIHQGQLDQADSVLQDAVRVLRASGMGFAASYGELLQSRIHLARGDLQHADEQATRVVAEFAAGGHSRSALEASLVRVQVKLAASQPQEALRLLDAAERAAKDEAAGLHAQICLERAQAFYELGDPAAGTVLAAGLATAQEQGLLLEEGLLLDLRASHPSDPRGSQAAEDAEAAAAILGRLGVQARTSTAG